ncbi:anthocyanidin 3-O-glucosyltransferase 6 [Selaginella moellendorffii]|nr:anthocyanidin 3-O-glucosyltransferase 6 [Selaginella moellendorffii]|eukprot:XP_002981696.2 anthocyanidin 3-O-glucosyltransferase 6 [Selaginella moellendorffii]
MANIVLVTVQGGGHFNTGMLFAKKLASQGCRVTVLLPWLNPSGMTTDIANIEMRALMESTPSPRPAFIFPGVRKSRPDLVPSSRFPTALPDSLRKHLDVLRPKAVVLDRMVMFWASQTVEERGIPKYILYTGASAHLAVMLSFHGPSRSGNVDQDMQSVVHVPGLPPLRWAELPLDVVVKSHGIYLGKEGVAKHFVHSNGILLNTSEELEGPILDALHCEYPEIRCIPVGPLYPSSYLQDDRPSQEDIRGTAVSIGKNSEDSTALVSWLDKQPTASLVLICFGSFIVLGDEMIRELAHGLESSGFAFLWSLPSPRNEEPAAYLNRVLPPNFAERTSGRGKILTGWVPQQLVLSHPAIGALVSHCGWSSVVECILLAGVPILAWPFLGDQLPTCRHLVDEYKIAVDIGVDGVPSADDVERGLRAVMEDQELRNRAKQRRKLVRQAALSTQPGSSGHNLAEFISSLAG